MQGVAVLVVDRVGFQTLTLHRKCHVVNLLFSVEPRRRLRKVGRGRRHLCEEVAVALVSCDELHANMTVSNSLRSNKRERRLGSVPPLWAVQQREQERNSTTLSNDHMMRLEDERFAWRRITLVECLGSFRCKSHQGSGRLKKSMVTMLVGRSVDVNGFAKSHKAWTIASRALYGT